jgi:N-acetylmuramoyl-L-alanine amidase
LAVFFLLGSVLFQVAFRKAEKMALAARTKKTGSSQSESVLIAQGSLPPKKDKKIGLQVGHWKNNELPNELAALRRNGGATGGGKAEWEVNLAIAEAAAKILETRGYSVDILPATVPPGYQADVFIAIHADGSENHSLSGYKVAAPWNDSGAGSAKLAKDLEKMYGEVTKIKVDPNITSNMKRYYAFNHLHYDHAIKSHTPAVILETGYLTGTNDRQIIVQEPEKAGEGIAEGVDRYFQNA